MLYRPTSPHPCFTKRPPPAATRGSAGRGQAGRVPRRIQVRSEAQPSLDGGWFRAFDYERWEAWGSNADAGWGAWAIESGWTQAWITSVLAMREMNTSLWDLTKNSQIERHFPKQREEMLPEAVVKSLEASGLAHAAAGKPIRLITEMSKGLRGGSVARLSTAA